MKIRELNLNCYCCK